MGGLTPLPVRSALRHFGDDFARGGDTVSHERVNMTVTAERDLGTKPVDGDATVAVSVDGREVTVPEGTSVIRAASLAGIDIPKLCATDRLDAFGSCRVCLVEIEGRTGTPASCTTPVAPGMQISTTSERLARLRQGVMELYLSDHPSRLPDRAGERRV